MSYTTDSAASELIKHVHMSKYMTSYELLQWTKRREDRLAHKSKKKT